MSSTPVSVSKPSAYSVDTSDLGAPENYINRDLSLLEFNRRVLEQAHDASNPLLERLLFLCICSGNLDEYFEVRVSGIKKRVQYSASRPDADGQTPTELLSQISDAAHELVREQYQVLNEQLLPALESQGIR